MAKSKQQTLKSLLGMDVIDKYIQNGTPLPLRFKNRKEFQKWITNWFQDQPIKKGEKND